VKVTAVSASQKVTLSSVTVSEPTHLSVAADETVKATQLSVAVKTTMKVTGVTFTEIGKRSGIPYAKSLADGGGRVSTSSGNAGGSPTQPPAKTLEVLWPPSKKRTLQQRKLGAARHLKLRVLQKKCEG